MIDHANIRILQGARTAAERAQGQRDNMRSAHYHEFFEIYYLEAGARQFVISNELYDIRPRTAVLLPPYTMHYSYGLGDTPFRRIVIYFDQAAIRPQLWEKYRHSCGVFNFAPQDQLRVEMLMEQILRECQFGEAGEPEASAPLLEYFAVMLQRAGVRNTRLTNANKIRKIMAFLGDHYADALKLDQLSERFFISKSYMCRAFRQFTGTSILEYLNSVRVLHASRLFLESDLNLGAIAEKVGFSGLNSFERNFLKYTGCSPCKKRREVRLKKQQSLKRKAAGDES